MRLTRQGALLAGVGVGIVGLARVFAIWELYVLGAALVGLVLVSALTVASSRLRIGVRREVTPVRLHAGEPARVDLMVTNHGERTPVLQLIDPVDGARGAHVAIGPLVQGERATAAYQLPRPRRGRLSVGPLDIEVADTFGLSKLTVSAAAETRLTVYPRLHDVDAVPFTVGDEIIGAAPSPDALGRSGDDFYALRQYTVGDDVRRIHWRSTARHDELMVRQQELPWNGRLTLLLDNRRRIDNPDPFELAVEATASLLAASSRRRDLTRLLTTDGGDSGSAAGAAHLDSMLEFLALVETTPAGTLQRALAELHQGAGGGALVVVLATPSNSEIDDVVALRRKFRNLTVVACQPVRSPEANLPHADIISQPAAGVTVLRVSDASQFVSGWMAVHGRRLIATPAAGYANPTGDPQ